MIILGVIAVVVVFTCFVARGKGCDYCGYDRAHGCEKCYKNYYK